MKKFLAFIMIGLMCVPLFGCALSDGIVVGFENGFNQGYEMATNQYDTTPTYGEEILYDSIPWGTSMTEVAERLGISEQAENPNTSVTISWDDAGPMMATSLYTLGYILYQYNDNNIAGYDVGNFKAFFHYGYKDGEISTEADKSELYLVTMDFLVVDIEGTYEDLQNKLTSIYGEGRTTTRKEYAYSLSDGSITPDVTQTTWIGQKDTGIKLTKSVCDSGSDSSDLWYNYVTLCYGKIDSESTLENIYDHYSEFLAKQENENRDTSNVNGL